MSNSTSVDCGGGCLGSIAVLLTVAFVVMKYAGIGAVAEWSWVWVLSPAWIYVAYLIVSIIFGLGIVALFLAVWALLVGTIAFLNRDKK